jgi:hypothetical protein
MEKKSVSLFQSNVVLSHLHGGHCFVDNVEHSINPGVQIFQKILGARRVA